jgi:hypothetical protein
MHEQLLVDISTALGRVEAKIDLMVPAVTRLDTRVRSLERFRTLVSAPFILIGGFITWFRTTKHG